jgi:hypothetical protein
MTVPCLKGLDADCFRHNPTWAKQAFAYRLAYIITPKALTKHLPRPLRRALIGPGVTIPTGVNLPPGTVVQPGATIPPAWTPGDPLPPGATESPTTPPGTDVTGVTPPTYTEPWSPGPSTPTEQTTPPAGQVQTAIIGSTADGNLFATDASWATVHNAPTNTVATDNEVSAADAITAFILWGIIYRITRSFLYFDLSSIPAGKTCISAIVSAIGWANATSQISIQKGTQHDTLVTADWNAFSGTYFSKLTWQKFVDPDLNTNNFTLDASGIAYVQAQFGDTAKFCLRQYEHDYLNVAPATMYQNGVCYADHGTEARRPYITIVYK